MFGRHDEESKRDYVIVSGANPNINHTISATPETAHDLIVAEIHANDELRNLKFGGFTIYELVEYINEDDSGALVTCEQEEQRHILGVAECPEA